MVQSWRIIGRGEEWGTYHQGSAMSETDCWMVKQFSQESVCVRDLAPAWIKAIIRDDKTGSENKNKTNFDHLQWMIMKPVQELSLDFSSGSISLASSMSHMERVEVLNKRLVEPVRYLEETAALRDHLYTVKLKVKRGISLTYHKRTSFNFDNSGVPIHHWHGEYLALHISKVITQEILVSICTRPWQPPNLSDVLQFPLTNRPPISGEFCLCVLGLTPQCEAYLWLCLCFLNSFSSHDLFSGFDMIWDDIKICFTLKFNLT